LACFTSYIETSVWTLSNWATVKTYWNFHRSYHWNFYVNVFVKLSRNFLFSSHLAVDCYVWSPVTVACFVQSGLNLRWLIRRSGYGVGHVNNVKLRRARLVLGLVTTFSGYTIPVFCKPFRSTQSGDSFVRRWGRNGEFCVAVGPVARTAGLLYANVIGSKPRRLQRSKGMSSVATDLAVYAQIFRFVHFLV